MSRYIWRHQRIDSWPTTFHSSYRLTITSTCIPAGAFADDLKFVADVTVHPQAEVQTEVDKISLWLAEHNMPLSLEKIFVLHGGHHQPLYTYMIDGSNLSTVDRFVDLGVHYASSSDYVGHCAAVAAKASRISGVIHRAFLFKLHALMWPAFQLYVLPILMYGSQAWKPFLKRDVHLLEGVQKRYTKAIRGMRDMSYAERLRALNALSVVNQHSYVDIIFAYKCVHRLANISAADIGLAPLSSNTRGCGYRLEQNRPYNKTCGNIFPYRAVSQRNKLPIDIIFSKHIKLFKIALH